MNVSKLLMNRIVFYFFQNSERDYLHKKKFRWAQCYARRPLIESSILVGCALFLAFCQTKQSLVNDYIRYVVETLNSCFLLVNRRVTIGHFPKSISDFLFIFFSLNIKNFVSSSGNRCCFSPGY